MEGRSGKYRYMGPLSLFFPDQTDLLLLLLYIPPRLRLFPKCAKWKLDTNKRRKVGLRFVGEFRKGTCMGYSSMPRNRTCINFRLKDIFPLKKWKFQLCSYHQIPVLNEWPLIKYYFTRAAKREFVRMEDRDSNASEIPISIFLKDHDFAVPEKRETRTDFVQRPTSLTRLIEIYFESWNKKNYTLCQDVNILAPGLTPSFCMHIFSLQFFLGMGSFLFYLE